MFICHLCNLFTFSYLPFMQSFFTSLTSFLSFLYPFNWLECCNVNLNSFPCFIDCVSVCESKMDCQSWLESEIICCRYKCDISSWFHPSAISWVPAWSFLQPRMLFASGQHLGQLPHGATVWHIWLFQGQHGLCSRKHTGFWYQITVKLLLKFFFARPVLKVFQCTLMQTVSVFWLKTCNVFQW